MERIRRWWYAEWDWLYIAGVLLIVALLVGGMISATVEAFQHAASYQ